MNRFTTQFKEHANATLAADERARMRVRLERAMSERPAFTPSPYASRFALPLFVFSQRAAYAFAAVLLIVGVSGSTAYAAEGSIPGDLLYTVKVNVNEPLALALAVTPQSKADTHAAIATARLAEAQTLAVQGSLSATTSAELADSFTANVSAASAIADSVATSSPAIALAIRTNLSDTVASGATALLDEGDRQGDGVQIATGAFVRRALRVVIADDARHSASTTLAIAATPQASSEISNQVAPSEATHPRAAALMKTAALVPTPSPSGTEVATFSATEDTAAQGADSAQTSVAATAMPFDATALDRALAAAEAKFDEASSTLDASTTASVQRSFATTRLISVNLHADVSAGDDEAMRSDYKRGFNALAHAEALLWPEGRGKDNGMLGE